MKLTIIYRISNNSYKKERLEKATKENCLKNALKTFSSNNINWLILGDNLNNETFELINTLIKDKPNILFKHINSGSGAASFNIALDEALKLPEDEWVYFLEDDYFHLPNSYKIIKEGTGLGANYISLYDHPDKYINGANPEVEGGGEVTRLIISKSCHWKITNSTTMTFVSSVKTLKEDESILRKWTKDNYPEDFKMFLELRDIGRVLITPVPGFSTHCEKKWLTPSFSYDNEYYWNNILNN